MLHSDIQTIVELLSLEFQRFKRYGTPGSLVVVETDCTQFFSLAESQTRKLDLLQQVNTNLYVIVYAHTKLIAAQDALRNILELHCDSRAKIKIGICEVNKNDISEVEVVKRAFKNMHTLTYTG